jgi:membrane protein DedA with SNARE-associated domain
VVHYGYWAVAIAILLEDFGVPLPGEALLISAALLASQGDMHIVPLLLFAWSGAVMGDNIGYAIGRFAGRRVVLRYGHYLLINKRRLGYAEGFFKKHGGSVVVIARFFEVMRQLNGLVAGIAEMPWSRFLSFNALGAALWVCFWGILFYEVGDKADVIRHSFKTLELILVVALVAAAAIAAFWLARRPHGEGRPGKQGGRQGKS